MNEHTERRFSASADRLLSTFLSSGALNSEELRRPPLVTNPEPLPERIDRFEIRDRIAVGGMGSILRAHDPSLDRMIAIKLLHPWHLEDAELVNRFIEEAKTAGRLQHPGIVPIHEMGTTETGAPYFTMKIVDGDTLGQLLDDREDPLSDHSRFLPIFERICETVAYAHARDIAHGDLKPGNVMVSEFGEVQVLDWGFASTIDPDGRSGPSRILGTPSYMSPEQARGDRIRRSTDVFELGAILCEILTGAPPFLAETRREAYLKASKAWLEDAHARLEACGADAALITLTNRCMEPDPKARPAHAGIVGKVVAEHIASVEERAQALQLAAVAARARAAEERRRWRLTLLASLVVGLVVVAYLLNERRRQDGIAQVQQNVVRLLEQADLRAGQARLASPMDGERFHEALGTAEHAAIFAEGHDIAEELRRRADSLVAALRNEHGLARRNARFLERIHEPRHEDQSGRDDKIYAKAFREWGVDVLSLDPKLAASKIQKSAVREQAIQALDSWAHTRRMFEESHAPIESHWKRISDVGLLADDNPWRNEVRRAVRTQDLDHLRHLARSDKTVQSTPDTLILLVMRLAQLGDARLSVEILRAGLARSPDSYLLVHGLQMLLWPAGGTLEEILAAARMGTAVAPHSAHAWVDLGRVLSSMGRSEQAVTAVRRALVEDPRDTRARLVLSSLLRARGDRAASMEVLLDAPRRESGENVEHLFAHALEKTESGHLLEAVRTYDQLLRFMPGESSFVYRMQALLSELHQGTRIATLRRTYMERLPESSSRNLNLGLSFAAEGQPEKALPFLRRGHEARHGTRRERSARWIRNAEDDLRQVRMLSRLGSGPGPEDPKERILLARLAVTRRLYGTALRLFVSAFEQDPATRQLRQQGCDDSARVWAAYAAAGESQAMSPSSDKSDQERRLKLRQQALSWMREDLEHRKAALSQGKVKIERLRRTLARWLIAVELAPFHDQGDANPHLTDPERREWSGFFADVEKIYKSSSR